MFNRVIPKFISESHHSSKSNAYDKNLKQVQVDESLSLAYSGQLKSYYPSDQNFRFIHGFALVGHIFFKKQQT